MTRPRTVVRTPGAAFDRVVDVAGMRRLESATAPEIDLMHRAGSALAAAVRRRIGPLRGRVIVALVGPGDNGGDALIMARLLVRQWVERHLLGLARAIRRSAGWHGPRGRSSLAGVGRRRAATCPRHPGRSLCRGRAAGHRQHTAAARSGRGHAARAVRGSRPVAARDRCSKRCGRRHRASRPEHISRDRDPCNGSHQARHGAAPGHRLLRVRWRRSTSAWGRRLPPPGPRGSSIRPP